MKTSFSALAISLIATGFVIGVYALFRELRVTNHGKIVLCTAVALFVFSFKIVSYELSTNSYYFIFMCLSTLGYLLWILVMFVESWLNFHFFRSQPESNTRFKSYFAFVFLVLFIQLMVFLAAFINFKYDHKIVLIHKYLKATVLLVGAVFASLAGFFAFRVSKALTILENSRFKKELKRFDGQA
jgi:hypothetical protein